MTTTEIFKNIARYKLQVDAFALCENASLFVTATSVHKSSTEQSYNFLKGSFPGFKTNVEVSVFKESPL